MGSLYKTSKTKLFLIPVGIASLLSLISYVVMLLWNNLLPEILHVGTITFWQAMGIFILCKLLFGFGKPGGGGQWGRRKMLDRLKKMSPEEREVFKAQMKHRMCGWESKWDKHSTENL